MDSAEVTAIKQHIDIVGVGLRSEVIDLKRHISVVAEGLSSEIRLVAEATSALDAKLDREVGGLREKMDRQFDETRELIRFSCHSQPRP